MNLLGACAPSPRLRPLVGPLTHPPRTRGARAVHVAAAPLGNGTSQPSAERTVANLREEGHSVAVDDEAGEKILKLVGALEENDDVQNVYANFEISDALIARLQG